MGIYDSIGVAMKAFSGMLAVLAGVIVFPLHTTASSEARSSTNASDHWAFKPPSRSLIPAAQNCSSNIRNPIDAFIFAEHSKRGLTTLPEANPAVLLRRVYLDLIGLPPTREELQALEQTPQSVTLLGLDPRKLEIPGRKRLEIDYGDPIQEILA